MLEMLLAFVPVAALLSVTPGVSTALVVRNAARGGRRAALRTTVGNGAVLVGLGVRLALERR